MRIACQTPRKARLLPKRAIHSLWRGGAASAVVAVSPTLQSRRACRSAAGVGATGAFLHAHSPPTSARHAKKMSSQVRRSTNPNKALDSRDAQDRANLTGWRISSPASSAGDVPGPSRAGAPEAGGESGVSLVGQRAHEARRRGVRAEVGGVEGAVQLPVGDRRAPQQRPHLGAHVAERLHLHAPRGCPPLSRRGDAQRLQSQLNGEGDPKVSKRIE